MFIRAGTAEPRGLPRSSTSACGRMLPLTIRRLHLVMPDLSKLRIGARNWRLETWWLRCWAGRGDSDLLQFPRSICRIVSEQKASAWNSWCSTGLILSISISSGPRATPETESAHDRQS